MLLRHGQSSGRRRRTRSGRDAPPAGGRVAQPRACRSGDAAIASRSHRRIDTSRLPFVREPTTGSARCNGEPRDVEEDSSAHGQQLSNKRAAACARPGFTRSSGCRPRTRLSRPRPWHRLAQGRGARRRSDPCGAARALRPCSCGGIGGGARTPHTVTEPGVTGVVVEARTPRLRDGDLRRRPRDGEPT